MAFISATYVRAQNAETARGVVIYKDSPHGRDELASVMEFSFVESFSRVVNVTPAARSGGKVSLVNDIVVEVVNYTDFLTGTIATEQQIAELRARPPQLGDLAKKHPKAYYLLAAEGQRIQSALQMFDQGKVLISGEWKDKLTNARSADGTLHITTEEGKRTLTGVKVLGTVPNGLRISHSEGAAVIPSEALSEDDRTRYGLTLARTETEPEAGMSLTGSTLTTVEEGGGAGEERKFGGIDMVWCPPGVFVMGLVWRLEPQGLEGPRGPQRLVTLTQGFWLAKYECTQGQWESVMGSNPSHDQGADLPVGNVTWNSVQVWLKGMSERHPLSEGWRWELPTEAQWEYACRAGSTSAFGGTGNLDEMGWFRKNSGYNAGNAGKIWHHPRPGGEKQPNVWGLYDMHGNAAELCRDWYEDYIDEPKPAELADVVRFGPGGLGSVGRSATDPIGPPQGSHRVARGGSFLDGYDSCFAGERGQMAPDKTKISLGFRPAIVVSK